MADQLTPLGGSVPGTIQAASLAPAPIRPSAPPPPPRPAASAAKAEEGGASPAAAKGAPAHGLDAAAKSVADFIQQAPSDLKFMVDKATGQYYFKIVDPRTHETIRQVPSEEVLAMARRLQQLGDPKGAKGVLVDAEG